MNYNTINYYINSGIATISLNRQDRFNAFNSEMRAELLKALHHAKEDKNCRVIVLTAEGKAFCAGQDLKDIEGKVDFAAILKNGYNPLIQFMKELPKPIIGRINGVAAGAGCSLALACDFIIADSKATFVEAFVSIGLVLDSGSSYFLPRLVGSARAFELATTGNKLTAEQAYDWGMINRCVSTENLDDEVQKIALYYANAPTKAIGMMKKMLNDSMQSSLSDVLEYETNFQELAGNTTDFNEGVTAFLEKRKPRFKGN
tara:strand:+ start:7247 stop:8023 length:777 start_codon:yes stop_codon:yes gene_type:complete